MQLKLLGTEMKMEKISGLFPIHGDQNGEKLDFSELPLVNAILIIT